jgi:hypothetical protein
MNATRLPAPAVASQGIVDSIVQGSTVDLFEVYGVAVAPRARTKGSAARRQSSEYTGVIGFDGPASSGQSIPSRRRGELMLDIPLTVLTQLKTAPGISIQTMDWIRELTNQLAGRIKNRLLRFHYDLQAGLPTVLERRMLEHRPALSESATFYGFRTMRGEVQVILDGTIDESTFAYAGDIVMPSEGDVIIF